MLKQGESSFSLSYTDLIGYKLKYKQTRLGSRDCFAHDSNW